MRAGPALAAREKKPFAPDWPTRQFCRDDFRADGNIGVILGTRSGGLVCVDLDNPVACELAPQYLPATAAIAGRPSSPRSHWFYLCPDVKTKRFSFKGYGRIVELLADGTQVVIGPSVHPDGEEYSLLRGEPAEIDADSLTAAVERLHQAVAERLGVEPAVQPAAQAAAAQMTSQPAPSASPALVGHGGVDVERRAIAYMDRCPPAISGQGGHPQTFTVAQALVNGFGLSDEVALRLLAQRYNPRCEPPWSERELEHKVKSAREHPCDKPAGWLLNDEAYSPAAIDPIAVASANALIADAKRRAARQSTDTPIARVRQDFQPFPIDALPEPLATFVHAASKAIGCDPSFITLPVLIVAAAMIGMSRVLELKRGWRVPSILWAAIVGESGTQKTPVFKLAMRPVRDRQRKAMERYAEVMRKYENELARWEKAHAEWRRSKRTADEPPAQPEVPQAERCLIEDATVESVAPILLANPRGLLLARDELAGWLGSFDRYSNGKGADAAHWLSMYNAENVIIDRKSGVPRTIFVPRAAMSIVGGIQPGTLRRALGVEHRENGLLARLLLACPPRQVKRWTDAEIGEDIARRYATTIEGLAALPPAKDEEGGTVPVVLRLSPEAKAVWREYYETNARELADLTGELAAAWSKLEETAARLALVIHCVKNVQSAPGFKPWSAEGNPQQFANEVDRDTMSAAVQLTEWFKFECRRVYDLLGEDGGDEDRKQRRLVELIRQRGGAVTVRDLMRADRRCRGSADDAENALNRLATCGLGRWDTQPTGDQGGRPARVFRLNLRGDGDITTKAA